MNSLNTLPIDLIRYLSGMLKDHHNVALREVNKSLLSIFKERIPNPNSQNVAAAMWDAGEKGSIDYATWMIKRIPKLYQNLTDLRAAAAFKGNLDLLKWSDDKTAPYVEWFSVFNWAIEGNQMEVLKWLKEKHFYLQGNECGAAAIKSNLIVLRWLWINGYSLNKTTFLSATLVKDNLEVVKWLRANGCPWDVLSYAFAPSETRKWLLENGCPWDESTFAKAAEGYSLETLQWLKANGCPWDEKVWPASIKKDGGASQQEILNWLYENGCPWDEQACTKAVLTGNLALLKWLREKECPWDASATFWAKKFDHTVILAWLCDNGCPEF